MQRSGLPREPMSSAPPAALVVLKDVALRGGRYCRQGAGKAGAGKSRDAALRGGGTGLRAPLLPDAAGGARPLPTFCHKSASMASAELRPAVLLCAFSFDLLPLKV